jgi:hypothetical protein
MREVVLRVMTKSTRRQIIFADDQTAAVEVLNPVWELLAPRVEVVVANFLLDQKDLLGGYSTVETTSLDPVAVPAPISPDGGRRSSVTAPVPEETEERDAPVSERLERELRALSGPGTP